jgi:hypothetical protein
MPLMLGTEFTYTQIDKKIYVPLPNIQVRRMAIGNLKTLLEILSYATTPHATGMQLHVACNYFCNYAPFLGVYATMVQL